ncbi:MAG: twin-arginine translocase TatA/TatE family subunit [Actinomycetota bacterium]|nr:twin-arginine translocase TatA/TatE family subunit [Actinomycetota bacterium]
MFNLDPTKFLIVVAVALVVLGPDKVPAAARSIGRYWNEFQRIRGRLQAEMNGALSTISDAVGPIGDVINMGVAQVRGPIGVVGSMLAGSPQNPLGAQAAAAPPSEAGYAAAPAPAAPSGSWEAGGAWSTVDGVVHPPVDSDPYLN